MAQQLCLHSMQREDFIEKNFPDIRAPFSVGIELTAKCNMRCVHCYNQNCRTHRDMDTGEVKQVIDILCENGAINLFFTGGEVFMRPDFSELYIYAKKKGLIVSVLSNITMLTERHIQLFTDYPVSIISTTMYGYKEQVYERVTQVEGSYGKFMRGLALLQKNRIPYELKFVVMKQNVEDLYDVRRFGIESGVNTVISFGIFPAGEQDQSPVDYRVFPEEAFAFDMQDSGRRQFWDEAVRKKYEAAIGKRKKKIIQRRDEGYLYNCNICFRDTFINSQGYMQGCIRTSYDQYDLLHGSFQEGWAYLKQNFRDKKASAGFACNNCDKLEYCEQCSAIFHQESGDPEVVDTFFCRIAELRKNYVESEVKKLIENTPADQNSAT